MIKDIKLPSYLKKEEKLNVITHVIGIGLGVIVLFINVIFAIIKNMNFIETFSLIVYSLCMIVLYSISSIYHGLRQEKYKKIFRVIDHSTIYLLIAGTYTPICFMPLKGTTIGMISLLVVWIGAAIGILLNAFLFNKKITSIVSMLLYVITGWIVIFGLNDVIKFWGVQGFVWTLIGGLIYTIGIAFYAMGKQKPYRHTIWHIFVVLGSLIQFLGIFFEIILIY